MAKESVDHKLLVNIVVAIGAFVLQVLQFELRLRVVPPGQTISWASTTQLSWTHGF